jgi:two-component system chemotaxis sensor kinase CheA
MTAASDPSVTTKARRQFLRSIQGRLFGVIFGLIVGVVAFLVGYFPSYYVRSVRDRLEQKAETYSRLVARQVESAVAFDDRATVREVFDAMAADKDIRAIALYDAAGRALFIYGEFDNPLAVSPRAAEENGTELLSSGIRSTVPVISKEGPRGTLVLELSGAALGEERRRIQTVALVVGLAALGVGLTASWLIARSLGKRLRRMTAVTAAVAAGNLTPPPLGDESADEIGQLARSFDYMINELRRRNADIRLVLDHVGEGFLTLDRRGVISTERSAIVEKWLGQVPPGYTFWDYVKPIDERFSAWFKLSWEALFEDVIPFDIALDQMPKFIRHGSRHFRIRYSPIMSDGAASQVLLVLADVTSEIERENAESAQRELLNLLGHVMKDRLAVFEFLAEGDDLVRRILADDGATPAALMPVVHTLKGNCGFFGLVRLAKLCHELETQLVEMQEMASVDRSKLAEAWRQVATLLRSLTSERAANTVEVALADFDGVRDAIAAGHSKAELLERLSALELEPAERRLARIADQAHALAARLGKPELAVRVESNDVRLDAACWAPFWSAFFHVVRNAVDHGIESPDERIQSGKLPGGVLTLRTVVQGAAILVELADDGRGIDWEKLAQRAQSAGLPHKSRADLEAALFRHDISTKDGVNENSGRGAGLAAVHIVTKALGATAEVRSVASGGTTFSFRVPTSAVTRPRARVSAKGNSLKPLEVA